MTREEKFMLEAIKLAEYGVHQNCGGPFGCIVVKDDQIIGKGYNKVTSKNDPTAHAEIVAIRDACTNLNSFQLEDCEIYTTCEPCPMCLGAIYWARPKIIYFAGNRGDAAAIGFDDSMIYEEMNAKLEERRIPIKPIGRSMAQELFKTWDNKPDKIEY
jgi:tRNA(Arg) A34 adenosine deaminase TadA